MRPLLLFFSFVLLASCGKKTEESSLTFFEVPSNSELNAYGQDLELDEHAPEGLGTLLSLNDGHTKNVSICTWFLVSPELAMTNSHCIPVSLKSDLSQDCGQLLQGSFKTSDGKVNRSCKKIIMASKLGSSVIADNDFALIQLNKPVPDTHLYSVSRNGVEENELVKIHTMNHSKTGNILSRYIEHNCIVKSSDVYGSTVSKGASPLIAFKESGTENVCRTVGGNSGSPVVNAKGELIGILHGGMKDGVSINDSFSAGIDSKATDDVAIFTNLRCLKFGSASINDEFFEDCKQALTENNDFKARLTKETEAKILKIHQKLKNELPPFLQYHMDSQNFGTSSILFFVPKCIKPMEKWSAEETRLISRSGFFIKRMQIAATVNDFQLTPKVRIDYYGNIDIDFDYKIYRSINFTIKDLQGLRKGKEAKLIRNFEFDNSESLIEQCVQ